MTDHNDCTLTDTIHVKTIVPGPSNFLATIDSVCQYDKIRLQPTQSFSRYNWSNGSSERTITIELPGTYRLSVVDSNGCNGSDTIQIVQKNCLGGVYIPNAFTPNNDYVNDEFKAKVFGKVILFQLFIYNRYGQLVFSSTDPYRGWNGKVNGKPADSGTFVYQCAYHIEGEPPGMKKGTVLLVR